jgi:ABC-type amino acid transport substrate-binding protein
MQGYTLIVDELLAQMPEPPSHVVIPAGVGGLAAAIAGRWAKLRAGARPRMVVVEPQVADCVFRSLRDGTPRPVEGDVNSFMACLSAGEVSPAAWPILRAVVDDALAIPDGAAKDAMVGLARGRWGDAPLVSGESGCASVAAVLAAAAHPPTREVLGSTPPPESSASAAKAPRRPSSGPRSPGFGPKTSPRHEPRRIHRPDQARAPLVQPHGGPMTTLVHWSRRAVLGAALAVSATALMAQESQPGAIDRIIESGVLRIGVAEGPPYQFPDPATGEYVGLNIDLANEVAAVMGVELEIVPATWATLVTGLEVGQYDVIFANLFATPERALSVAFTEPYDTYGFHVAVKADSPIASIEELNDPSISFAGVAGTVEAQYPKELFPNAVVNELVTDQAGVGFTSVLSGQSTALFVDPGFFRILSTQNPDMAGQLKLLNGEDALLKPVSLAYAVRYEDQTSWGSSTPSSRTASPTA